LTKNDDVKVNPQPTEEPIHTASGQPLPDAFAEDRATLQEEEEGDARIPAASHGEYGAFVEEARRQERAEHEADVARDLAPGDAAKDEEGLAKELVPAPRPKLVERLCRPRVVHHRGPGGGRVAEDGDGEERQEVVDGAEADDEGAAGQDVDRGRDEEAGGQGDVREEDAPACGIADARDELDGGVEEVEGEEAEEEGAQRRAEEGAAFLRPRGRWRVHALAKVPSEAAHGKHELEGILRPGWEEAEAGGVWLPLTR